MDIAEEIQLKLSENDKVRMVKQRSVNPAAYEPYLRGRFEMYKLTEEGMRRGIEYFEKALAIDPGDARYSSGLADAYVLLVQVAGAVPVQEGMAKAGQYARRALAADENSAEAHTSMAAALFFGDWNRKEAERHLRRAIQINPGYAVAHLMYSSVLCSEGRMSEATAQDRLALELDPLSIIINWHAIGRLCEARRFDDALAIANRALALDPASGAIQSQIFHIYENTGDSTAALDVLEKYLPESEGGKERVAVIRRATAASGRAGYWRATLDYQLAGKRVSPMPETTIAMLFAQVGDNDHAMEYLERAYQKHSGDLLYLGVEPYFDPMRGDPRFQALIRRVDAASAEAG
jgi:tetratricopeptide (TPR) repeat protein